MSPTSRGGGAQTERKSWGHTLVRLSNGTRQRAVDRQRVANHAGVQYYVGACSRGRCWDPVQFLSTYTCWQNRARTRSGPRHLELRRKHAADFARMHLITEDWPDEIRYGQPMWQPEPEAEAQAEGGEGEA